MTTDVQSCAKKAVADRRCSTGMRRWTKPLTLFWQHGYEGRPRSADLVEATGAKAPTLYAEFVNKEGLFRAVLDRYISRFAAKHEAVLFAEGKSVDRALRDYFTAVATCFTSKERRPAALSSIPPPRWPPPRRISPIPSNPRHAMQGRR